MLACGLISTEEQTFQDGKGRGERRAKGSLCSPGAKAASFFPGQRLIPGGAFAPRHTALLMQRCCITTRKLLGTGLFAIYTSENFLSLFSDRFRVFGLILKRGQSTKTWNIFNKSKPPILFCFTFSLASCDRSEELGRSASVHTHGGRVCMLEPRAEKAGLYGNCIFISTTCLWCILASPNFRY